MPGKSHGWRSLVGYSPWGRKGSDTTDFTFTLSVYVSIKGFPGGSAVKNPPVNAVDLGSVPGSGRTPGEENGNPLQYSCLDKSHGTEESSRLQSMGSQRVGRD